MDLENFDLGVRLTGDGREYGKFHLVKLPFGNGLGVIVESYKSARIDHTILKGGPRRLDVYNIDCGEALWFHLNNPDPRFEQALDQGCRELGIKLILVPNCALGTDDQTPVSSMLMSIFLKNSATSIRKEFRKYIGRLGFIRGRVF